VLAELAPPQGPPSRAEAKTDTGIRVVSSGTEGLAAKVTDSGAGIVVVWIEGDNRMAIPAVLIAEAGKS
jgi:hypothetical protein